VVLGARDAQALEGVVDVIRAAGGRAAAIPLDVSDQASCAAFAARAVETAGLPDFLVNNAGVATFRPVDKFEPDEFERQFRVNVFGVYYMTRLALPLMRENGSGTIVNVSSLAGEGAAQMGSAYFATKHALNGFTKCVMEEARQEGIRVALVCPGSVDTAFHVDSHPGMHTRDQTWMVRAADIADAVVHALSAPPGTLVSRIDVRPVATPPKR